MTTVLLRLVLFVHARSTDFNMASTPTPADGVITGYGLADGNLVYVYSQDASVMNGAVGEMHAKKILKIYELAFKNRSTGSRTDRLRRYAPSGSYRCFKCFW